ncbi:type II secretion system minor pseudopilin GspK [Gammaproteobacteria bacterium]|jgi:general secretion pathway protein K|nr:type II secretion system minor pseudopilin GspK [Gammaproteobacteria bacterium]
MHYKTKGVVLISVLLTVLLLSSIAVVIGNNYFVSFKRAQYLEFQTVSLNIFSSIESLALKKIDNELRFNSKFHAKNNALFTNDFIFETQKGLVSGKIIDSSNCFNINSLVIKNKNTYKPNKENIAIFERLLSLSEIENNLIDEAIDQIIDWIDADDNPRAFGLEDYYYSGPLNNPKEYTSARIFYSIQEIKSLPAIRDIGWQVFEKYFCALPDNDLSININTITGNKSLLLSSLFENLPYSDAEYVIDNIPEDGIKNLNELSNLFPSYKLEKSQNYLNFSSSHFELVTSLSYESYYSESKSKIYYGANNNSYIISRIYNGI